MMFDETDRPVPKAREFFLGLAAVVGAILATRLVVVPLSMLAERVEPGAVGVLFAAGIGVPALATIVLAVHWWKLHRWRAYGVLSVAALPPLLGALFLFAVSFLNLQIGPR